MNILREIDMNIVSKILSSSHINFMLGAGVNGRAVPQMKDLVKTREYMKKLLGRDVVNFEYDLNEITSQTKKTQVMKIFINELRKEIEKIDTNYEDIKDIENLLLSVNNLVIQTENRNITMKQVNIYTTNYDSIVEDCLDRTGLLYNAISSSNYSNHDKFFEMIGYDYRKRKHVPTYLVSKIHGDLTDPILPNVNKYDDTLQSKRFEILFNMRAQLSRPNSVLFIIGYSGGDKHINSLIRDCLSFGLTVYWFKYDNDDTITEDLDQKVIIVNQPDNNKKRNTTINCKEVIEGSWRDQLEE